MVEFLTMSRGCKFFHTDKLTPYSLTSSYTCVISRCFGLEAQDVQIGRVAIHSAGKGSLY